MAEQTREHETASSRRAFIKRSSLLFASGAVGGPLSVVRGAHCFGSDTIRLGVIGCGRRGTRTVIQALDTLNSLHLQPNGAVCLTAMADLFADRVQAAYRAVRAKFAQQVSVKQRRFTGFDAYLRLLESDVDVVIMATPPSFRPLHFEAAVQAGKHVYLETPVAVDAPGVRRVLTANVRAKASSLAVAVGLRRHHEPRYQETIRKLRSGAVGDVRLLRTYCNSLGRPLRSPSRGQSDLEFQVRNWTEYRWLSGDPIVEKHVQQMDVANWLKRGYPVECAGVGGCFSSSGLRSPGRCDHHFVEYTYADGGKLFAQCRQLPDCWNCVAEFAQGIHGSADISGGKIYGPQGELMWRYGPGGGNGDERAQAALFTALRNGDVPNELEYGAKSTLAAIMGRMATVSGRVVRWEEAMQSHEMLADVDGFVSLDQAAPV
jgi:predicted dehydrogenase